jgi:MFS transporter, PPP family, 3-phenylpropionic acid transporter
VTNVQLRLRLSLLYASVYLHFGLAAPYLPVWFNYKGASVEQIGILMSVPMFLKVLVVAPITSLADRLRRVRDMLFLTTAAAVFAVVAMTFADGFWELLAVFTVFALLWDPIPVLVDAYAITASRARDLAVGRLRTFGSLAFIASNLVGGRLLDVFGAASVAWWCALALAIPLFCVPLLPKDSLFTAENDSSAGNWRGLLRDRRLLMMMAGAALLVASHSMANNFLSIQWLARGASGKFVGILWAAAMTSEVVVLWFAQRWLAGRSPIVLALAGAIAAAFRWSVMALSPNAMLVVLMQALQGISGTAPILAVMLDVERRVPPRLTATAQGINAVVLGAAIALVTLASGFLWRTFGTGAYVFMAGAALMGLCALVMGAYIEQHERRAPPDTRIVDVNSSAETGS